MSTTQSPPAKKPVKMGSKSSQCLCGAIKLTVSGADKGAVLCHCSNCQIFSGSAFAYNYRFLNADIQFESGEDQLKSYTDAATKTGGVLVRYFCSSCGSSMFLKPEAVKNMVVLCAGGAQDRTCPGLELFKENRHDWMNEVAKAKPKM